MAEASHQILHAGRLHQILAQGDKPPLKGSWSRSCDPFFKMLPQSYLDNWWS